MVRLIVLLVMVVASLPARAQWTNVSHTAGPAWQWNDDTDVRVIFANCNTTREEGSVWTRGLYVRNHFPISAVTIDNSWYGDERYVPIILACPPVGSPPLVDGSGDTLVLAGVGSAENGCGELGLDQLEILITPHTVSGSNAIDIEIEIRGVPYMGLPATGTLTVTHASGTDEIDADTQAQSELADTYTSADSAEVSNLQFESPPGYPDLSIDLSDPPWTQVQGHWYDDAGGPPEDGFLEVDFDHGCEETWGMTDLETTISFRLPYGAPP